MRLAVFDHQLSYGGGRRFLSNLLCALADIDHNIEIVLFCNQRNAGKSEDFKAFKKHRIVVKPLKSLESADYQKSLIERSFRYAIKKIKPNYYKALSGKDYLADEIAAMSNGFDVAYFPWPFLMKAPETSCPKVATFHDFNFKYFFGVQVFNKDQLKFLNDSIRDWLKDTTPVVSTNFMKNELQYFYPEIKRVNVIHLASLNRYDHEQVIPDHLFEYKYLLDKPYIVFPVHVVAHKNIGNVIAAASIINKDHFKFRLVLTGNYTEMISGRSSYLGLINEDAEEADVHGLGYVTDIQMHYLLQRAFAVLNASFYEAGNGVGLDAWPLGVPVIQSDIPAFEEHLNLQGFSAFTFDPRDVRSIVKAIEECLYNVPLRESNIEKSLVASKNLRWEVTAGKYLEIFRSICQNKIHGN